MLNETMTKQTRQTFNTLRTAIQNCPDDLWRQGSGEVRHRLGQHGCLDGPAKRGGGRRLLLRAGSP